MSALALGCPAEHSPEPLATLMGTAERDLQRLMQRPPAAHPGYHTTPLTQATHATQAAQAAQVWVAALCAANTPCGALQAQDATGAWVAVQRAHSCLVAPQPGDVVQVVQAGAQCWVVAVLVSARPDQGLVLDASGQTLTLQAQHLQLRASGRLSQEADTRTSLARLCIDTSQERQTRVQGTDTLRAKHALTHVERHHSLHAGSATLTASALLKVDAAQIHMG